MSTLGIDLGTGSVKAAVLDDAGAIIAKRGSAYRVHAPHSGWAESDPADWLAGTRAVVADVLADTDDEITAVGFSGQMHGVVVVDADLAPLRPAVLWADGRSTVEAAALQADLGAAELSRLGSPAVTGFAATTLAWLRAHEPEVMARAAYVLQPKDWLRAVLGGGLGTDPSDASGTLLYDVVSGSWSTVMLEWLGLDPALLPPVLASHDRTGAVLLPGRGDPVPAAVGGADTACALAGLGLGPGSGFVAVGSGAQVVRVMSTPDLDASLRTHTFATVGAVGQGWYRIGAVQSSGLTLTAALSWLDATIPEASAALARGVQSSDPVFVPYLSGERTPFMDPTLRGSWHGLSLATDRPAMLRSILEGVAQAVALGVEAVQGSGEPLPDVVPLIGGGTHDPAFQQLLADATGLTLAITDAPDSAVVGAGLLARGPGAKVRPVASVQTVTPRPDVHALLADRRAMMVQRAQPKGLL